MVREVLSEKNEHVGFNSPRERSQSLGAAGLAVA